MKVKTIFLFLMSMNSLLMVCEGLLKSKDRQQTPYGHQNYPRRFQSPSVVSYDGNGLPPIIDNGKLGHHGNKINNNNILDDFKILMELRRLERILGIKFAPNIRRMINREDRKN